MAVPYQLVLGGGGRQACSTAAGTAIQLTTTATPCMGIEVSAISTNTAPVVIGDSTSVYAAATRVGYTLYASTGGHFFWTDDVSKVYLIGVSTEAVSYIYYRPLIGTT